MRGARGAALLLALWAIALLAALLAALAAGSGSEAEAARYDAARTRARYAAEAGLARAVAALRDPVPARRFVPDGRDYRFGFGGAAVDVRIEDVSGQVDLNAATGEVLQKLFSAAGAPFDRAQALADAVQDWRDSDAIPRMHGAEADAYRRAGMHWVPRNGPFRSVGELARVYGMDGALFRKLEPAITVYSGRNFPDASYAGPLALAALRDGDLAAAEAAVAARRKRPAQEGAGNGMPLGQAAAGNALVAGFGGLTVDVRSVAALPNGTRAGIDAILRLSMVGGAVRPYAVLGWRDDTGGAP